MWLFDANADIRCGNSLTQQWSVGWIIRKGGYIVEVEPHAGTQLGPSEPPVSKDVPGQTAPTPPGEEKSGPQLKLEL
jgi:hypothetical protein